MKIINRYTAFNYNNDSKKKKKNWNKFFFLDLSSYYVLWYCINERKKMKINIFKMFYIS